MVNPTAVQPAVPAYEHLHITKESTQSAISWAAVIGGAVAALAISIIVFTLGSGIGFSTMSPWSGMPQREAMVSFTVKTAIWMIVMQWLSALIGGYVTGRMRTKWTGLHTREVFVRDVVHGFLAWALATVLTSMLVASAASAVVSGGAKAATLAAAHAPRAMMDPDTYFVESMYRADGMTGTAERRDTLEETSRILAQGLRRGDVPEEDRNYLAGRVMAHTGLTGPDARARVDATIEQMQFAADAAKQAAEEARRSARTFAFFTFFSMVIGAFIASVAAALGGQLRDEY